MDAPPTPEATSREGRGTVAATDQGNAQPLAWGEVERRVGSGGWFWLATVGPHGPHLVPVLAAWSGTSFFVASKGTARKSRDLDGDGRCLLSTDTGDLHVVVEGNARRVRAPDRLGAASAAFATVYDCSTTVAGEELDADFGAPSSGGPPYRVYEIEPDVAFAFPTDGETTTPTRWRFRR